MQYHRSVSVGLMVICALAGCVSPELKQAHRFAADGQWDQAVAAYQEAQRKAPFDEKIPRQLDQAKVAAAVDHYTLGKLAFENHRLAEALHEFKLTLGLDPNKAEYDVMIADALRLKESQEQLQIAKKLLIVRGQVEERLDQNATLEKRIQSAQAKEDRPQAEEKERLVQEQRTRLAKMYESMPSRMRSYAWNACLIGKRSKSSGW